MPRTHGRRRILLYCNRFSKVVRIRAAPDDQQRCAGQRYQSMLEWWSREQLPPSFRSNVYSCITSELAGKCAFWRRRLESQSRSWWLLLTRSRTRPDHVERGNEWTEGGDRGEDERADGGVRGANRKSGLPAAIGRVNRAVRITDYRQPGGKLAATATPAWRIGNDVPITDTHEVWTSNAMKLMLL